ncbi:ABC transporter substrate-binding protein [Chamaesiphon sp. GL140_3_metabinner_50]|uniref:protein kinase domain-containing protein n=1 Tax=Chamaesiphon sp. GL140_3_metabinner_50 TaxID=2970812 RepID=UPI0025F2A5EB|nr:ABC transporter substrate-binding protein [Chamaesiphon sp. GL140_3_metabinner_50]
MDIYCTRPRCEQPLNSFSDLDDRQLLKTVNQRHCANCGMPLILDGRYLPSKILQQGGLGVAFLGCDRRTPGLRQCVIKQLQLNPSFNTAQLETATTLFHREAEVLEKLGEHPQIPRLFAFLEMTASASPPYSQQKFFYLVQEYIEGKNLQTELAIKGRFTEPEVISVLREVAKILEFIHFKGSIHRDIKPSNIMRDLQGQIYLIDFGAVKQIVAETARASGGSLTCVFTPEYAPWEQRQGQAIYPSSDLYALAVTCLNLLTGRAPQDLLNTDTNEWKWRTPDLQVSDALAEILDKMLRSLPSERFQSARDVLETIEQTWGIPVLSMPFSNMPNVNSTPLASTLLLGTFEESRPVSEIMPHHHENGATTVENYPLQPDEAPLQIYNSQIEAAPIATKKPWLKIGAIAAVLGLGAFILGKIWQPNANSSLNAALSRTSSTGDRLLLTVEGSKDTDRFKNLKQAGILALTNKKYDEAITNFQAALNLNPNSPETRIYLNNALIGDRKSYTIAVSAPISRSLDRASEMLRGFAQAQSEMNQSGGVNDPEIKLRIVDDSDDPKTIESIATGIAEQPEILGIVGHNRNDVTMKASVVYDRQKIAYIAPISTANELTSADKPYVFRTNIKGDAIAQKLVDRLVDKDRKRKVAIFYVPTITYNDEFKTQFANKLTAKGGQVVGTFKFSNVSSTASPTASPTPSPTPASTSTFDPEAALLQAKAMGAEAILVLPVGRSNREALKVLKIRAEKYPELSVLSDTALYSVTTLKAGRSAAGLIMGVPWQESESSVQFSTGAQQLWNTQVNWATATSYNAVKAMGMAIKADDNPSRTSVMKTLAKNEFPGASGRLQFTNGEPTDRYILVQVAPTPPNYKYSSRTGFDFVPIE